MPNKDYDNFVARMGSFDDNFDDIFEGIDLNSHIKGVSHMDDNQRALSHFGVPGMKWGVRKAAKAVGRYAKETGKLNINAYAHPILTRKALYKELRSDSFGKGLRKSLIGRSTKEMAALNNDVAKMQKQKAQQKQAKAKAKVEKMLAKKEAQQKVKDLKRNHEKEFMEGKSKVGKIISGVTGAHKIYADVMYDLNDAKR